MKKNERRRGGQRPHCTQFTDAAAREIAALHALGSLPVKEAAAYDLHIAAGCAFCARELQSFQETLGALAAEIGAERDPPAALRARVLARIAEESPAASDATAAPRPFQVWTSWADDAAPGKLTIHRAQGGGWEEIGIPGIAARKLHVDANHKRVTMLVRMAAGTSYPAHRHRGIEECYVLEGDLSVGDTVLHAGDYQRAELDSMHGTQSTRNGCLLLIVGSQSDEVL